MTATDGLRRRAWSASLLVADPCVARQLLEQPELAGCSAPFPPARARRSVLAGDREQRLSVEQVEHSRRCPGENVGASRTSLSSSGGVRCRRATRPGGASCHRRRTSRVERWSSRSATGRPRPRGRARCRVVQAGGWAWAVVASRECRIGGGFRSQGPRNPGPVASGAHTAVVAPEQRADWSRILVGLGHALVTSLSGRTD